MMCINTLVLGVGRLVNQCSNVVCMNTMVPGGGRLINRCSKLFLSARNYKLRPLTFCLSGAIGNSRIGLYNKLVISLKLLVFNLKRLQEKPKN